MSRVTGYIALWFVLLAAITVRAQYAEDEIYNNELFPRNSLYGRFRETLVAEDMAQRQFAPFNQNTGQGFFSLNPLVSFLNRLPLRKNPEFTGLLNTYASCKSPDGEMGLCLGAGLCTVKGGKASGSCNVANVCCINTVAKCSGTITLNNTYWQSPATPVQPQSTCAITVRLDQNLPEQKKQPVCQIRVDLIAFTIAQPDLQTVCATDKFQVSGGTISASPVICGDNNDQHMYLDVESSARRATDVQLTFSFGAGVVPRNWNIKVVLIPCGATYAAPPSCLQYFTGSSGTVKSFNWIDTAAASTRQLANQDYSICFRSELISDQRANSICYQVCTVNANDAVPFQLSLVGGATTSSVSDNCLNDFLIILNGVDAADVQADRFCGARLNPTDGDSANVQVCSTARQFRMHYRTNGDEGAGTTLETNNVGFCLSYMQRQQ